MKIVLTVLTLWILAGLGAEWFEARKDLDWDNEAPSKKQFFGTLFGMGLIVEVVFMAWLWR
jgi:hypothetical protein